MPMERENYRGGWIDLSQPQPTGGWRADIWMPGEDKASGFVSHPNPSGRSFAIHDAKRVIDDYLAKSI